ncbi:histidine phosphatase family protein [Fictibacillus aquaticus]|uniref:Histidine phosphatase family protein n=1 Tax=Fictibacillus aquaticus TaxID=2021314 RepID=A0A235FDU7_9BACL|nr:histidine phosphatase family protein [Fictibacillus aquaticus]OYD59382.1 histidine phosphatase family protein [Fictibacillus aquaticus]
MSTFVYMVRHGESPKEGNERTRVLTEKGLVDAQRVTDLLKDEQIDIVVSSPYIRSISTVENLAKKIGKDVLVIEDLKERIFSPDGNRVSDQELAPLLEKSFLNPDFTLEGGESNADCQQRAVTVLKELLNTYRDKKVVFGSHGAVMTLMMGYFNDHYDLSFLKNTTKPDIYRMEFNELELVNVQRLWSEEVEVSS